MINDSSVPDDCDSGDHIRVVPMCLETCQHCCEDPRFSCSNNDDCRFPEEVFHLILLPSESAVNLYCFTVYHIFRQHLEQKQKRSIRSFWFR